MPQSLFLQKCRPETLAQFFFCEFGKIFKNTYFEEHLQTTASTCWKLKLKVSSVTEPDKMKRTKF